MDNSGSLTTSPSLLLDLRRARGHDHEDAWIEFVNRYGSRIYDWCLNRKLQSNDAEDVTQRVLVKMAMNLESFEYDESKSFRGWLRRVTENALIDFFREQRRNPVASINIEVLEAAESQMDLTTRLAEAFDLELLDRATENVRQRVNEKRFYAWWKSFHENKSGTEIAEELSMKVASVYTAKNQVQKLLQLEVRRLEQKTAEQLTRYK